MWPEVKDFTHRFALALSETEPERFLANMSKAKRKGRIFIDYLRNQRGATAILPYAARARPHAPVAAPVSWDELRGLDTAARFTVLDGAKLIEQKKVVHPALQRLGRMCDVACQIDQHAMSVQGPLKGLGHLRLVFHQQDAHVRPRPARTTGMKGGDANTR